MPSSLAFGPWRSSILLIYTLLLGFASGTLLHRWGAPLPWLLGSLGVTWLIAARSGGPKLPLSMRNGALAILGMLMGCGFSPALLGQWPVVLLSAISIPLYLMVLVLCCFGLLRQCRFSSAESYYGAIPGGMSEMVSLGSDIGARPRTLVLLHSTRIVLVVTLLPWLLVLGYPQLYLGGDEGVGTDLPLESSWLELALLVVACGAGIWRLQRWRFPAPWIIGSLWVSGLLHLVGLSAVELPTSWIVAAQLVIGVRLGLAFPGITFRELRGTVLAGIALTLLMLSISAGWAWLLHLIFPARPWLDLFLAYAPGGMGEMGLIAYAVEADIGFVTSHHLLRFMLIVSLAAAIQRRFSV